MRRLFVALAAVLALSLLANPAFSQSEDDKEAAESMPMPAQTEEMSIYGEVKSLDGAANSIALQYYDYDNDEEKTADIALDKDTKMENAAALGDIKQGDWVDAVYVVKDGKNIAKSVIVEREEEEEEAPTAALPEEPNPDQAAEEAPIAE